MRVITLRLQCALSSAPQQKHILQIGLGPPESVTEGTVGAATVAALLMIGGTGGGTTGSGSGEGCTPHSLTTPHGDGNGASDGGGRGGGEDGSTGPAQSTGPDVPS